MKKLDKKTALICNYYILNYGSVLQSYALFYTLKKLGCNPLVIQYHDKATKKQKIEIFLRLKLRKLGSCSYIKNLIVKKKAPQEYYDLIKARRSVFDKFINTHFEFTEPFSSVHDIQAKVSQFNQFVLSSDQLWSPEDIIRNYHTLQWLPDNVHSVAYATSFGVEKLSHYFKKKVEKFIPKIKHVSVRELSGSKIIKGACGRSVPVVMDPTLLLSQEEWLDILSDKQDLPVQGDYIFVYLLGANCENYQKIKEFAKSVDLPIVSIPYAEQYHRLESSFANDNVNADPGEFISLVKNAKYVIGDSFHMCVFSLIFKKQFLVLDRYSDNGSDSRNTRIENILEKFQLKDRHVRKNDDIADKMIKDIDYNTVDVIYKKWYEESMHYLTNSLDSAC